MVEMVWRGILDINMVENGMEWMKWVEIGTFPILFSFFSLSYFSLSFSPPFLSSFFLSSSFLHFHIFFSFSSSLLSSFWIL